MDPLLAPEQKNYDRLRADCRRMGLIYGIAIIILTLTLIGMVFLLSSFQITFSFQSPILGAYDNGIQHSGILNTAESSRATSTRP